MEIEHKQEEHMMCDGDFRCDNQVPREEISNSSEDKNTHNSPNETFQC